METSSEPAADLAEDVVLAVIATGAALQQRLDNALGDIKGITFSEHRLLSSIANSAGNSGSRVDLARSVGLTPSGVTRALRPLEKLGMVETIRDTRDARRSLASLTPQGQELLADAEGVLADAVRAFHPVQEMPPEVAEQLLQALERLNR
ncbi:MAG: MarR family winged helix-turn-helix transcriptional regulator [Acidimicrobiales bacterium]